MIIVRNTLDETITGRFAGMDYRFPPNQDTPCDEDVARHIFGFGGDDNAKDAALLRLGWVTFGQPKTKALERLAKIVFKQATVEITPVEAKKSAA